MYRVSESGELAAVQPQPDIRQQFPMHCDIVGGLIKGTNWKVGLSTELTSSLGT